MADARPAEDLSKTAPSDSFLPERVSLLYRFSVQDIPSLLVATVVTAFALWGYAETRLIVLWLAWVVLACGARITLHLAYRRVSPPPAAAASWETSYAATAALLGAAWGACILIGFPSKGDLYQIIVPSLVGAFALGMPSALSPSPKAFTSLLITILAPLVALLFTNGGFNTSAGMLLLVYTGVVLGLYLGANRTLNETLKFGRENLQLSEKLREADHSLAVALTELKVIFESAAVGLASLRENKIAQCNQAFASMFGRTVGEMTGQPARIMYRSDEDLDQTRTAAYKCFAEGQPSVTEIELLRKDGGTFWASMEARALDPARVANGIIVAVHDITPRKNAERELLVALQREKELNEMKTRFVSTVSHEFRTPLATILSSAELLRLYPDKLDDSEKLELLRGVEEGTKRMRRLLDEVLTLGRAESGKLQLRPTRISLPEFCRKIVGEIRIGEGKQHEILLDDRFDLETVEMDENLLRHILNNLLSNAIKYSEPGSKVTLALERLNETVSITVQDSGIGIPEEDRPRMFESFHRASNVENRQGTGLGLSIVKKAVELHGGTITFESKIGTGTRFLIRLPLQARAPEAAA